MDLCVPWLEESLPLFERSVTHTLENSWILKMDPDFIKAVFFIKSMNDIARLWAHSPNFFSFTPLFLNIWARIL